jgi:hypothetical protein
MKALFIVNKGYDKVHLNDHIQRMRDYYSRGIKQTFGFKPIDIEYDVVDTDIDVAIKKFGIQSQGLPFYGTANVKDEVRKLNLIPRGTYNVVFFCYNAPELPQDAPEGSYIAPMVYWKGIHPETEWSEIPRLHEPNTLKHEMVHALCKMLQRQGLKVIDQMDRTLWNGEWIPYFKNSNPYELMGNYSITLVGIQPYVDRLDNNIKKYAELAPTRVIKTTHIPDDYAVDYSVVDQYIQTPNVYKKTYTEEPAIHIIHKTIGDLKSVLAWFADPTSNASAHFVYDRDGRVIQLAKDNQRTWHTGISAKMYQELYARMSRPAKIITGKLGINPNKYSMGHEFVCSKTQTYTPAQYESFLRVIDALQKRNKWKNGVAELNTTLMTHEEFVYYKPDLEVEKLTIIHRSLQGVVIRLLKSIVAMLLKKLSSSKRVPK